MPGKEISTSICGNVTQKYGEPFHLYCHPRLAEADDNSKATVFDMLPIVSCSTRIMDYKVSASA